MRVLATFETRDIASSMKDLLTEHGIDPNGMIIMVNRGGPQPPEDAELEVGTEREKGFAGLEEKIGKTVNALIGKSSFIEGTGSEGSGNTGALLEIKVVDQAEADRAVELLTLHQAADIEVVDAETEDLSGIKANVAV